MIFNLAVTKDDDGNAAGGKLPAKIQRNLDRLKPGGSISDRAMQARVAEAWRRPPPEPFVASQAGKRPRYDECNPPPYGIPDHAAKELNRQLHPMNDGMPDHSVPPREHPKDRESHREMMKESMEPLDHTDHGGIPGFCKRRK
jgi:hypothetical protein